MWHAPQGVHDLLREYFYFKSADWEGNRPFPLKAWTASELAKMPTYYIMDLNKGVAATVSEHQPSPSYVAACKWMTEADLQVYSQQFQRTGFQGGLNYYRIDGVFSPESGLNAFSGKTIDVPAFLSEVRTNGPLTNPQAPLNACTRVVRSSRVFT
jgi:hypothetical protein